MIARASVVLPEPDSPTSARHSRAWSWSETPCSTWRAPWNASHALDLEQRRPAPARRCARRQRRIARAARSRRRGCSARGGRARPRPSGGGCLDAGRAPRRCSAARRRNRRGARPAPAPGPGIASSSRRLAMSGIAPISLRVYGCAGACEEPARRPALDDAPGVHHEHALRRGRRPRRGRGSRRWRPPRGSGRARAPSPARAPASSRRARSSARRARSATGRRRNAIARQTRCC